jgi:4-hydroxybenzoate polyprenyltransferase
MLRDVLRLMRPKQWAKNLLVFAALVFTRSYEEPRLVALSLIAFAALCLASSAAYAFNDALDASSDREHPRKKNRPVASGALSPGTAYAVFVVLALASMAVGLAAGSGFTLCVLAYLVLQGFYNLLARAVPVLDVSVVAAGFVLRAAAGAIAISVSISGWLLLCTGALALLVGFSKRRYEFRLVPNHRESLGGYTSTALDSLVVFSACSAALSYGVYSIQSESAKQYPMLILTAPVVGYAIMRYLLLVFAHDEGGEPETLLLSDAQLLTCLGLFLVLAYLATHGWSLSFVGS